MNLNFRATLMTVLKTKTISMLHRGLNFRLDLNFRALLYKIDGCTCMEQVRSLERQRLCPPTCFALWNGSSCAKSSLSQIALFQRLWAFQNLFPKNYLASRDFLKWFIGWKCWRSTTFADVRTGRLNGYRRAETHFSLASRRKMESNYSVWNEA